MKAIKTTIPFLVLILIAACSKPDENTLEAKQKELKDKETELADLKAEISKIKQEIIEMDTNARSNAIAVRAIDIQAGMFKNPFQIQGLVESDQNVMISPEVPAKLIKIHVKEGQKVYKGQLIATLDGSVASSQISELENALILARTNYEKQERLWNQNIGSEMQYLQAKNNYENLQKSINTARQQLGKYSLRSPINGTVDAIMANEGELVGSLTGGPIARVVNLKDIKVKAKVSERYISMMNKGQDVQLHFPSIDLTLNEKIAAVGNVIDANNRTFTLIIKPSSNLSQLKPNMLSMITAYDFIQDNTISVPTRLVRTTGEDYFVYVINSNGNKMVVEKRIIEIGQQFPSATIITKGLENGDRLITEGVNNVIPGDEVKVIEG
ncbi:MAG: efflux RND transporter periplasmic adaptor subunit [Bacteroidia bacterium]